MKIDMKIEGYSQVIEEMRKAQEGLETPRGSRTPRSLDNSEKPSTPRASEASPKSRTPRISKRKTDLETSCEDVLSEQKVSDVNSDIKRIKDDLFSYLCLKSNQEFSFTEEKITQLRVKVIERLIDLNFYHPSLIKECFSSCLTKGTRKRNKQDRPQSNCFFEKTLQIVDASNLNTVEKINKLRKKINKEKSLVSSELNLIRKCENGQAILDQISQTYMLSNWIDSLIKLIAIKRLAINSNTPLFYCHSYQEVSIDKKTLYLPADENLSRSIIMHGKLFPSSFQVEGTDLIPELSNSEAVTSANFIERVVSTVDKVLALKLPSYEALTEAQLSNVLAEYFSVHVGEANAPELEIIKKAKKRYCSDLKSQKKQKLIDNDKSKELLEKFDLQQLMSIRLEKIYQKCPALRLIPFFSVNFFSPASMHNRTIFSNFLDSKADNPTPYRMRADAIFGTHYDLQIDKEINSMKFTIYKKYYFTKLNDLGDLPELIWYVLPWEIIIPLDANIPLRNSIKPFEMYGTELLSIEDAKEIFWLINSPPKEEILL